MGGTALHRCITVITRVLCVLSDGRVDLFYFISFFVLFCLTLRREVLAPRGFGVGRFGGGDERRRAGVAALFIGGYARWRTPLGCGLASEANGERHRLLICHPHRRYFTVPFTLFVLQLSFCCVAL